MDRRGGGVLLRAPPEKHKGGPEHDAMEFLSLVKERMKLLELKDDLLKRLVFEVSLVPGTWCLHFGVSPSVSPNYFVSPQVMPQVMRVFFV